MFRYSEVIDAGLSLFALYLSAWLYETANWFSLSVTGFHASISFSGFLPVGVIGYSSPGTGLPIAKLLQVGICVCATLAGSRAASKKGLPFTSVILVVVTGSCVSSIYWEMLSLTSFVPIAVHQTIYLILSVLLTFGLLRIAQLVTRTDGTTNEAVLNGQ